MSTPVPDFAFTLGEVTPALFGRFDAARMHVACSTLRNLYVGFHGGAYSRAGTAFVGFSKQTGRSYPPRLIPFQQSIDQGLCLEFGNFYMRVIFDGAFVTDLSGNILGITTANPLQVSLATTALGAQSATVNTGGVSASYAPGEIVTLAGGVAISPTRLQVPTTKLAALGLAALGSGYAPSDTINLSGGVQSTTAVVTVGDTQVVSVATNNPGTNNGVFGVYTFQGTTGTGTKFTISLEVLPPPNPVTLVGFTGGQYSVNPSNLSAEPVTLVSGPAGGTWTGLTIRIGMGIFNFTISNAGVFTTNPSGGNFSQASTSGSGSGASFNNALMVPTGVNVYQAGVYTSYPTNPVAQASSTGSGRGATFTVTTTSVAGPTVNVGDWLFFENSGGTFQINGQTLVAASVSGGTVTFNDVYGNAVNASSWNTYTGGGTFSRIYTLPTPYGEQDLPWLKSAQSADVMSLCLVNQGTNTEYAPQDLERFTDSDWVFTPVVPTQSVVPPTSVSGSASTSGSVDYAYVVTALSPSDGSESTASNIGSVTSAVDVASTAGTITLTWTPSATHGVRVYNVYKAQPGYSVAPPAGSLFGFAGQAYGPQFLDSNIVADFSTVPPTHQNPFARGQITGAAVDSSTGTVTTVSFTINTSTGSGAVLEGVIVSSALVDIIVLDPGQNYGPSDTVTVTVTGGGSATATLQIGAQSGTYPGCVSYFQERRAYGYTLNQTDTYFMSQPGAFTNFDFRIPTIDSDAIIGSPWSQEVNGIQWMLWMPQGLLVMTGLSAWLLVGAGSFATNVQPISPSSQDATPQAFTGVSATVPPIKINYDVLYVNSKGSLYFDLPYQMYALSEPLDISQNSLHLFQNQSIVQHAWCEQPFKLLWAVRDDGILLSLTWLKVEQVCGWGRHDTFGTWESVCSIIEPIAPSTPIVPDSPGSYVDALYLAAQRTIGSNTAYTIERMDNRDWLAAEDAWCVDCGFSAPLTTIAVTLTASSATGLGAVTGVTGLVGGSGYSSATTAQVIDAPLTPNGPLGPGTGAVATVTVSGGVITSTTFSGGNQGTGYLNPQITYIDPAGSQGGSGASATCTLSNTMTLTASATCFSSGNVGDIVRMGGGIIEITAYTDTEHVTGNVLSPIIDLIPNSGGVPEPALSGEWTIAAPVSTVYVPQLAGATVTGLADGNVIPPTAVPSNGIFPLPQAATAITIGFGFTAQLQSVYLDADQGALQGQRKKVADVTVRFEASRDCFAGTNQPDGSVQSPQQLAPLWTNLDKVPNLAPKPYNGLCQPLYTGDSQAIPVTGGYQKPGQVAIQQALPVPLQVLALVPRFLPGDIPDNAIKPRQRKAA